MNDMLHTDLEIPEGHTDGDVELAVLAPGPQPARTDGPGRPLHRWLVALGALLPLVAGIALGALQLTALAMRHLRTTR